MFERRLWVNQASNEYQRRLYVSIHAAGTWYTWYMVEQEEWIYIFSVCARDYCGAIPWVRICRNIYVHICVCVYHVDCSERLCTTPGRRADKLSWSQFLISHSRSHSNLSVSLSLSHRLLLFLYRTVSMHCMCTVCRLPSLIISFVPLSYLHVIWMLRLLLIWGLPMTGSKWSPGV